MADEQRLIAKFVEVSGTNYDTARSYLNSTNWSLPKAIVSYLKAYCGNGSIGPYICAAARSVNENAAQRQVRNPSHMGAVETPLMHMCSQLDDIFRDPASSGVSSPSTTSSRDRAHGMRSRGRKKDHTQKRTITFRLWRRGFTIDNGELRPYDDPHNREVLQKIMRRDLPHEFIFMGCEVDINIEDHRPDGCKSKTAFQSLPGSDITLGHFQAKERDDRNVTSQEDNNQATANAATGNAVPNAIKGFKLNTSQSIITLQIRLCDGSCLTTHFNRNHTIADIRRYIQMIRPRYANANFTLVTPFPTRELTDDTPTATLTNPTIIQRLH